MTDTDKSTERLSKIIEQMTKPMSPYSTDLEARLKIVDGIKAVFFDVYGTMLISGTGDIGISGEKNNEFPISRILKHFQFTLISHEENIDEMFSILINRLIKEEHTILKKQGVSFPEVDIVDIWYNVLTKLIDENYISGTLEKSKIQEAALSYECMVNPVWPMTGIEDLLHHLYNKNYKLGIISNAQFYTEEILKELLNFKLGLDGFDHDLIFYSYRENQAKPSKDFFLKAVTKIKKMYNIESEEILYIGNDMLNDIYTAQQCGCRTALFAGDRRSLRLRSSDERCVGLEPDLIITELVQLKNIL